MKRLAGFTAVALITVTVVLLLWEFRGAVMLFLLSLLAAAAVRPLIDRLVRHGLPGAMALLAIYALGLIGFGVLLYSVSGSLITELQQLINDLTSSYERIKSQWPQASTFQRLVAERLPPPTALYEAIAGEQGDALIGTLLGVTLHSFDLLGQALIILVLSVYWSGDRVHFERLWLSLLPSGQRGRAREMWRDIEAGVGAYIRSEVVQSLLAGLLLGFGYSLIGLKYPILLALSGALAWLIPWVGVLLATIPALMVGLAAGPAVGIVAGLYTLAVLLFLQLVIEPRLFNRRLYSSLLVAVLVLVMANIYGIAGLLLAPPLAAAIQIFFVQLFRPAIMAPATESARQIDHLQERLAAVREMISDADQPIAPEVSSLVQRLQLLVEEADSMLPAIQPDEATPEAASLPGSPLQKTVPLALEKQRSNT